MNDRFICPNCKVEDYFFDREILKCPTCNQFDFDVALYNSEGNIKYQELIKHKKSFFDLDHGEIYTCDVVYNNKIEKTNILPLIADDNSNNLFFVFEAISLAQNKPNLIQELKSKSFSELWLSSVRLESHIKFDALVIHGATQNDFSILSYDGWIFKNFVKV
jgi:hypothetical protein